MIWHQTIGIFLTRHVHKMRRKQSVEARNSRMGDDESLIETVRRFECLWRVRSRAYKCNKRVILGQITAFLVADGGIPLVVFVVQKCE